MNMSGQGSDASRPDEPELPDVDSPLADLKPSSLPQTLEEWAEEMLRKMEELGHNEPLRREISRRLS